MIVPIMNKNTKYSIAALIVIIIVAVVAIAWPRNSVQWTKYEQKAYGFSISYPADWVTRDSLTATSTCCLFIAHWTYATTTDTTASGTPKQTVTATETIKLQIGPYVRGSDTDPFKYGTTTKMTINGKTLYKGVSGALDYYLVPFDEKTGVGAAIFNYTETPKADKEFAAKIAKSLTFVATSTRSK